MASKSIAQRIFAVVSIILSVLVLLLSVTGIAGGWVARSVAMDMATGVLDGVERLAQAGRDSIGRLDTELANVRHVVGEVEAAADRIAGEVEDKGLVLTLLPPEKEQELGASVQQVVDGLVSVREVLQAVVELRDTIDRLPFVTLPAPDQERVQAMQEGISSVRNGLDELKADIHQLREGTASEVSKISTAASNIDHELEMAQQDLAQADSRLVALQAEAGQLRQRISTLLTIAAAVITLLSAWVSYAMVVVIRRAWTDLR